MNQRLWLKKDKRAGGGPFANMESDLENLGERIAQLERLVNEEGGVVGLVDLVGLVEHLLLHLHPLLHVLHILPPEIRTIRKNDKRSFFAPDVK